MKQLLMWGAVILFGGALCGTARAQTLLDAARAGDIAAVRAFLTTDSALVRSRDEAENTPLHFAAREGHGDVVELLLASGADVNAANYEHETPLHWAVLRNRHDVADLLLRHGAETEARENYGRTPLLLVARETGDLAMARRLLDAGADVNARDRFGSTPLELSTWRGFRDVVDLFLDRGAQVPEDSTAVAVGLGMATERGLVRLFRLLAERARDLNLPNDNGGTLLHSAAAGGSAEIAGILLDRGFDVNARDRYGRTPLHYAAENGRTEVVRLLLERGAQPNVRSLAGTSPLNAAEAFQRADASTLLVQHGASRDPVAFPVLRGPYLGQPAPGRVPTLFAPDIVSTHTFMHGTIVFSPDGAEAFWNAGLPVVDAGYSYGMIVTSHLENGRWTPPEPAPFSRPRIGDDVPFFHPDGSKLFFISSRDGQGEHVLLLPIVGLEHGQSGPYLGQPAPGRAPTLFAPDIVSTHTFMHGTIVFSPDGTEAFWNAGLPVVDAGYSYGRIVTSRLENGRWTPPEPAPFSRPRIGDDVPFFHPDGSKLFFISSRDGEGEHIWWVDRTPGGWSEPHRIEGGPNTKRTHWQFSVAADGSIYFNSGDPGGLGAGDLYISQFADGRYQDPVNVGAPVNSELDESAPFIAPDQSYLLFMRVRAPGSVGTVDLYVSFRNANGSWTEPRNLGSPVNSPSNEICPIVSPDGRYLFFNSFRNGNADNYWMDAAVIEDMKHQR